MGYCGYLTTNTRRAQRYWDSSSVEEPAASGRRVWAQGGNRGQSPAVFGWGALVRSPRCLHGRARLAIVIGARLTSPVCFRKLVWVHACCFVQSRYVCLTILSCTFPAGSPVSNCRKACYNGKNTYCPTIVPYFCLRGQALQPRQYSTSTIVPYFCLRGQAPLPNINHCIVFLPQGAGFSNEELPNINHCTMFLLYGAGSSTENYPTYVLHYFLIRYKHIGHGIAQRAVRFRVFFSKEDRKWERALD